LEAAPVRVSPKKSGTKTGGKHTLIRPRSNTASISGTIARRAWKLAQHPRYTVILAVPVTPILGALHPAGNEQQHASGVSVAALLPQSFVLPLPRFILCTMYILRPAKLLFTVGDGWNIFPKNTVTILVNGPGSPLSVCPPATPVPWAFAVTAVLHQTVPIPVSSARAVNQRPVVPAA